MISEIMAAAGLAGTAGRWQRERRRNPERELAARTLGEMQVPTELRLPEMPSIEYTLDPMGTRSPERITIQGTRVENTAREGRDVIAVLRTTSALRIGIIDRRAEGDGNVPFRNEDHWRSRFDMVLALDARAWRKDPRLAPAPNDPAGAKRIMQQCRWVRAGTFWRVDWVRYSADHHGYEGNRQAVPETEDGWSLRRNGMMLMGKQSRERESDYPAHVILETREGKYLPVERIIEDTSHETVPTPKPPGKRPGERTVT